MYYKILRDDLKHHGMQYKEGLNVNCEETILDDFCGNGLFFSDIKHILEFCEYGTKIAEVELPEGEPIYYCRNKGKAHRIILKNIRDLWTVETFEELVKNGADIHADNDSALRWASATGHLEVVKFLVQNGADIHAKDDCALQWASNNGHLEIVKYLVEHGANIHTDNDCALRWASENGHLEVVKFLVKNGTNIHTGKNKFIKFAALDGHFNVVEYLSNYGISLSSIILAFLNGYYKIGIYLLKKKIKK